MTIILYITDIVSPVFDEVCPRAIDVDTQRNQRTTRVMFDTPTATDNSGEDPVIQRLEISIDMVIQTKFSTLSYFPLLSSFLVPFFYD